MVSPAPSLTTNSPLTTLPATPRKTHLTVVPLSPSKSSVYADVPSLPSAVTCAPAASTKRGLDPIKEGSEQPGLAFKSRCLVSSTDASTSAHTLQVDKSGTARPGPKPHMKTKASAQASALPVGPSTTLSTGEQGGLVNTLTPNNVSPNRASVLLRPIPTSVMHAEGACHGSAPPLSSSTPVASSSQARTVVAVYLTAQAHASGLQPPASITQGTSTPQTHPLQGPLPVPPVTFTQDAPPPLTSTLPVDSVADWVAFAYGIVNMMINGQLVDFAAGIQQFCSIPLRFHNLDALTNHLLNIVDLTAELGMVFGELLLLWLDTYMAMLVQVIQDQSFIFSVHYPVWLTKNAPLLRRVPELVPYLPRLYSACRTRLVV